VTGWLERVRGLERKGVQAPRRICDPREPLAEMRLRKTPEELALLRRAAAVTAEAHVAAMRAAQPGAWEFEIEAAIEHAFRRRGASGPGYTTIVGAGANATVLHYIENSAQLEAGHLLLVDAGAEVECYTADVTRTTPIGGRFGRAHRQLYEAVLEAQLAAIERVRPGVTLEDVHTRAVEVLIEHLCRLRLLAELPADALANGTYRRFYMHRTSHWLGLDVHDAGPYRQAGAPRPLEPGFVLTVEPGLYVSADAPDVPDEYRGIGVRIEDDLVVTPNGCEVLTAEIPKQPAELERLAAGH
jgi:Xaa-Pro aminopeptidase